MRAEEKTAWINEENKIVSFHAIDNGKMITKAETYAVDDDLLVDMKGTIQYDPDHAVFEVTESSSDLVKVGTTWVFPEMQEGFGEQED